MSFKVGDKVTIEFEIVRIDNFVLPYVLKAKKSGIAPALALSKGDMRKVLKTQPKKISPKKKVGKK